MGATWGQHEGDMGGTRGQPFRLQDGKMGAKWRHWGNIGVTVAATWGPHGDNMETTQEGNGDETGMTWECHGNDMGVTWG